MFFFKNKTKNSSELDRYIKSHIPALYLLETERFENKKALIDDLAKHFSEQYHFKDRQQSLTPEFKKHLLLNYDAVMQVLTSIEPQYVEAAIDELWEGFQEDAIYAKYNKNGIINF